MADEERIELRNYFATPVIVASLPDGPAINQAIEPVILAREKAVASTQHSNIGGWQSEWDFPQWGGDAGRAILESATNLASRMTADRAGRPVRIDWKLNAWANVNREGHGNEFHTHPGSFWSGAYYVSDGGIADSPDLGGEFEIQDPRGVAPAMYAPMLCIATPGSQSMGASELIRPRAGQILLFPAWLSHQVRPYRGSAVRMSIAFNLSL